MPVLKNCVCGVKIVFPPLIDFPAILGANGPFGFNSQDGTIPP